MASIVAGRAVSLPGDGLIEIALNIGTAVVLTALAFVWQMYPRSTRTSWSAAALILLLIACPMCSYILTPLFTGVVAIDSPPWSGAVSGLMLIVAAAATAAASVRRPMPDQIRGQILAAAGTTAA